MTRLFTAEIDPRLTHPSSDVTITHLRAMQCHAAAMKKSLEPEIGHDGSNNAVASEPAAASPGLRDQSQNLIAIDQLTAFVGNQQPIGISIQRQANLRAVLHHLRA